MNIFLDNDILFIIAFLLLNLLIENLNPYITFFGGIIIVIVGIFKIIDLYFSIIERKNKLKKSDVT